LSYGFWKLLKEILMKKALLLASLILYNTGLFAQVKKTDDVSETFVGRSLNELDRVAANVGEEIKDFWKKHLSTLYTNIKKL